eukprot:UN12210
MIIGMFVSMLSGYLGDKYSPIRVLLTVGPIFLISIVILFPILAHSNEAGTALVMIIISMLHGLFSGPSSVWAIDQLPDASTRYSALGIGYNISLALFGGTAPLFATAITSKSGISAWAWVLFIYGVISLTTDALVSRYNVKRKKKNELEAFQQ